MRIAFVSQPRDTVGPDLSGSGSVGIVVSHLARALATRHEVSVLAPMGRHQPDSELTHGVTVRRVGPVARLLHDGLDFVTGLSPALPSHTASGLYYAEYYAAAARALRVAPVDAVVLETFAQAAPRLRSACPNVRLLLHAHDPRLALLPMAERDLRALDGVVTVSEFVTAAIAATHPKLPVRTIGNGVDAATFTPSATPSSGNKLLYVGRVSPEKGLHLLMPAMNTVVAERPDTRLEIVGPPGLLPYTYIRLLGADPHSAGLRGFYGSTPLRRFRLHAGASAYAAGLRATLSPEAAAATTFVHRIPHADLPGRFAAAAVFVLPSLWEEPFGLPLVEAMAAGLPVVATRSGAIPEIVAEGETGLLVERGDADGLARAILELLGDPERRQRMGAAARERVARLFTWDAAAARLEAALTDRDLSPS